LFFVFSGLTLVFLGVIEVFMLAFVAARSGNVWLDAELDAASTLANTISWLPASSKQSSKARSSGIGRTKSLLKKLI
jgi:hypothetical protein